MRASARPGLAAAVRASQVCQAVRVLTATVACALAAIAWAYLLLGRAGYWRTDQRLPASGAGPRPEPGPWPRVVAVVPARDEAVMLPVTLPTLLGAGLPGAVRHRPGGRRQL